MSIWTLEDAIHHAWKELRAMPLAVDSPAAFIHAEALVSLTELKRAIGRVPPSVIDAYVKAAVSRVIMLDVVDSPATAATVEDIRLGFRDAGY